jgi:hypothetical protein
MKDSKTIPLNDITVEAHFDIDSDECTIDKVIYAGTDVTRLIEEINVEWFKEQEDEIFANYGYEPDIDAIYERLRDK